MRRPGLHERLEAKVPKGAELMALGALGLQRALEDGPGVGGLGGSNTTGPPEEMGQEP